MGFYIMGTYVLIWQMAAIGARTKVLKKRMVALNATACLFDCFPKILDSWSN